MGHLYGAGNTGGPATLVRLCYSFQDLLFFFYYQHPWEAYVQSYRTAEWKTKWQTVTDTVVVPRWEKEMRGGKKGQTISAFLYLGSLFVVCFVRVLLMLVFKMCSVSPADAVGWENRSLLQRQNTTFVLEWVEESIRVPCEKFPERVTEEVCLICVLKYVRMLQYIQTSTRGAQTNTDEEMYQEHPLLRTHSHPKMSQVPDHFLNEWLMCFYCVWESEQRYLTSDASFRSDKVWTRMT